MMRMNYEQIGSLALKKVELSFFGSISVELCYLALNQISFGNLARLTVLKAR
jgi:hypothetical protein